eukprot:CAMPEP_0195294562 /NCGR_PEP_ID=MMETSP0707-20130614/15354_1 /TAXON_ID=33640 /ORGANISM="Asterionellopsis glacialis, Strain CCMP134" /LENGTH=574 /DNA_ID=CAMNT_0040355569 /DNA_START=149 /DNA_END=1873 /DNA_ORIENTATION=+
MDVHASRLTAFHAMPLVYRNEQQLIQPFSSLNHEFEKSLLLHALGDAERAVGIKIDVNFEVATMDRLEDFLARDSSSVMHFSCHGNRRYLAVENDHNWGLLQPLMVDRLKAFIAAGTCNLKVVFVSACQSKSAGEAFHAAGVPHVVCCPGTTGSSGNVSQTAAAIFARSLYRSLAYGKTLKSSFDIAKEAVLHAPSVNNPQEQAKKFLLLPEKPKDDPYHDIRVFFTSEQSKRFPLFRRQEKCVPQKIFPPPPRTVSSGHRVKMYHLLQDIQKKRFIKITVDKYESPSSIGTSQKHQHQDISVAKSVCHHIRDRSRVYLIDDVCWVKPRGCTLCHDTVSLCFQKILRIILKSGDNPKKASFGPRFHRWYRKLIRALHESHTIVFVDITAASETANTLSIDESTSKKLECFLQMIICETNFVRFVLVTPAPARIAPPEGSIAITIDSEDDDTLMEMTDKMMDDDSDIEFVGASKFAENPQELSVKVHKFYCVSTVIGCMVFLFICAILLCGISGFPQCATNSIYNTSTTSPSLSPTPVVIPYPSYISVKPDHEPIYEHKPEHKYKPRVREPQIDN